jgi:hypothetical protein
MAKVSWVVDLELITDWLAGLDDRSHELVIAALELLAERGPLLGRPLVDTVTSSRHNNMKELDPAAQAEPSYAHCSPSTRNEQRSCSSPATNKANGNAGTTKTSPSPTTCSTHTSTN